ncbi:Clp protease N-terminal domain-containing protein [Tengunoibacter tsumagoiensis]|uniref:Clp R domain-containing protein n=1 Tax=Tengunoibacter tsumagoiensis TaxID=2014871 RepID=A0A402A3Y5_9CHLR|nr:Clp protease N-terminal domain-containing protein [Tengunoibacter tsumagoiensis]GCE13867.1 hypothetical protein KTT_37260 [Tengunoibacter tsumagoiensis]
MDKRFDCFTERARKIVSLAQDEARFYRHEMVGTEHLLLAISLEGEGVAARVLSRLGATSEKLRTALVEVVGIGNTYLPELPTFNEQALLVFTAAMQEAQKMKQPYVGTEHILLGLTTLTQSQSEKMLHRLGITFGVLKMRAASIRILSSATAGPNNPLHEMSPSAEAARQATVTRATGEQRTVKVGEQGAFSHFTDRARNVLNYAHEEAMYMQHSYIGTEHLLLGLLREHEGAAAYIFQRLRINTYMVRNALNQVISRGEKPVQGQLGFNPRAQRVIERAIIEAQGMNHRSVGTEHLLLGLMNSGENIATKLIVKLGATEQQLRAETLQVLGILKSGEF